MVLNIKDNIMVSRNPSEYFRLFDELEYYKGIMKDARRSKYAKAEALKAVRELEQQLGIDGENYNSEKF